MNDEDVQRLSERAQAVGRQVGWDMAFVAAPNPELVGVVAGPNHVFVLGPSPLSEMAAHDIDIELDALERGDRQIVLDEDGDPRFI